MFFENESGQIVGLDELDYSSDGDDELTVAVLKIQKEYFKSDDEKDDEKPDEKEEVKSTDDRSAAAKAGGKQDNEIPQMPKIELPSVSEAFADIATQFIVKKETRNQQRPFTAALDHVTAIRSNPTIEAEPAVSSMKSLGLPEESWHVPLTAFDVMKTKKKVFEEEQRKKEKEVKRRFREEQMVKKRPSNLCEASEDSSKKLTIRERERIKRAKGQSSQPNWKPEAWMKLRQQYD